VNDPRYARRRRAAVPAALAAFTLLVVASSAHTPPTWAGGSPFTPAMTIVLPSQQVALAPVDVGSAEPPGAPLPLGDGGSGAVAGTSAGNGGSSGTGKSPAGGGGGGGGGRQRTPPIRHVFVVMLSQTDLVALAGDAQQAPYLVGRLIPRGTLLTRYDAIARGSLANGVALLSGQGPTAQTLADCPTGAGAAPADVTPDTLGDNGQQLGDGCIYPFATGTVADQLTGVGLDWRAYVEDAGGACPATSRDPFAYFHSLLDAGACARHVAGFDRLDDALAQGSAAPALLYIVPGPCHDGRATPCAAGAPAGAGAADAFLRDLVGRILASAAYADGGLIAITSDGPPPPAPATPPAQTAPTTPVPPPPAATTPTTPATTPTTPTVNAPPPGQTTPTTTAPAPAATDPTVPPAARAATNGATDPLPASYPNVGDAIAAGAARVGALLISPVVRAGVRSAVPASHFTLLRAISDLFALQPLGYAGAAGLRPLPEQLLRRNDQGR
jgi:hypothetical protein